MLGSMLGFFFPPTAEIGDPWSGQGWVIWHRQVPRRRRL